MASMPQICCMCMYADAYFFLFIFFFSSFQFISVLSIWTSNDNPTLVTWINFFIWSWSMN